MIKSLFNIVVLTIVILLSGCSTKRIMSFERNGNVEHVAGDNRTITVTSKSAAENLNKALYFAERNALENLLYRGIPKSNQENPMIANTPNDVRALNQLVSEGGYAEFLISSYNVNKEQNGGVFYVTQEVKFDLEAIRKFLEKNNLTRKFGL